MQQPDPRPRVAVVGSGVAGLTAAYVCAGDARVTVYEADDRLGGHAHTHTVREGERTLAIDTGFIVHNRQTYPTLIRLFDELGVETQDAEMSMSISDEATGVEWAGARGLRGLVPSLRRLADVGHLRMLAEIPRFQRAARALLADAADTADTADDAGLITLRAFVERERFSATLVRHFVEPLVAAVWSCDPDRAGEYPAVYLFRFLANHGMLSVAGSPTWRTVRGGSREYVDRLERHLAQSGGEVLTGRAVRLVSETAGGVEVTDVSGRSERYDRVVMAVHPHQALAALAAPTPVQREVLGAIEYSPNHAVLHTDTSLLPRRHATWGSWNFRRRRDAAGQVTVTYDLTRLQRLDTDVRYLVTLGGRDLVDPRTVIAEMDYEHPLYTPTSVAAQRRLPEIDTSRIAFAGAYHGWGFHEDGARSGRAAAERLDFTRALAG